MGFMNWLMKGVGFENEEVYDNSVEKEKARAEHEQMVSERKRQKEALKAQKAQAKADKLAKKYALRQAKDVDTTQKQKPESMMRTYAENPDQYNTTRTFNSSGDFGGSTNVGGYGTKNVEFLYPSRFEDVQFVINFLKEGEPVMLNLNSMNEIDSQRLLDCASGAIYALNGNIRRVDNNIFLLTPEGFNILTANINPNANKNQ